MATKYISVPHGDLGGGLDALSSEDSIAEGFSELTQNVDPAPEGYALKRNGYQGVWGFLPVRVEEVIYSTASTQNIKLVLDRSIDLGGIPSSSHSRPVVVFGRTSAAANTGDAGDFPTGSDAGIWYSGFSADPRIALSAGTSTTDLPATQTNLTTPYTWVGLATSTSTSDYSNTQFLPNSQTISTSTEDVQFTTTLGASQSAFAFFMQAAAQAGTAYVSGPTACPSGSTSTVTVLAATHGLATPNVQVLAWDLQGTTLSVIELDSVTLDSSDNVTAVLTNNSGSTVNLVLSLVAAPATHFVEGSILSAGMVTIQVPTPTAFNFVSCYLQNVAGTSRAAIQPDSVSYSTATGLTTVTFTVMDGSGAGQFLVYWSQGSVTSNELTLSGSVIGSGFTDLSPQLTLWGLDHAHIYSANANARAGWVTHLDTYRAEGEQFLVSGLGGNLFQGQQATPAVAAAYQIPTLFPRLRQRIASDAHVGPAFQASSATATRTRGAVVASNVSLSGFLPVASTVWDAGVGAVKVSMPLTGGSISGTPVGTSDQLTIQGAGFTRLNGTWPVVSVTATASLVTCWVTVPGVSDTTWDDPNSGAQAGIFTDQLVFNADPGWLPGDTLSTPALVTAAPLICTSAASASSFWGPWNQPALLSAGLLVAGTRTGQVLPLRNASDSASVTGFVGGDNVVLDSYARQMRVYQVNPTTTVGVTVTGTGTIATVTVASGNTSAVAVGDHVLLTQAGPFTGEQVVTAIPSSTTFSFSSAAVAASQSGTWQGNTITLDESLVWSDSVDGSITCSVPGRWLPLEAPNTAANEVPGPYVSYLPASAYDNQPILRSAQVTDSLMLNNGVDRPLKLDGVNIYRPGLPRWQPQLFLTQATGATGVITLTPATVALAGSFATGNSFYVAEGLEDTFLVGARITGPGYSSNGIVYTVTGTTTQASPSEGIIVVDRKVDAADTAAGSLTQTTQYSYYFRLNAVDANNNVVASAATGSVDWTVPLSTSAAVRIRLVGLPAWAATPMDFDRLEVQVYRTKRTGVAPFYLLTTLPMSFNAHDGYLDWVDTFEDELLQDLDPVNTALKGQELGTAWSQPIRSKRVTSLGNRLVLANVKSDPYLDMRLVNAGGTIPYSSLVGLRWLILKNFADTGTTTDNVNRVGLQLVNSGQKTISGVTFASNSFTVNVTAHGLSAGNWVYLFRGAAPSTNQQTFLMGWWQVASVGDANHFTINWANASSRVGSFTLGDNVDSVAIATDPRDVPVWMGVVNSSTASDWNFQFGAQGRWRLNVAQSTASGVGANTPSEDVLTLRLADALNATQRMTDRTLATGFQPWVQADAGGEFQNGQLILRQPLASPTSFGVKLPAFAGFNLFVNDVSAAASTTHSSVELVKPSRLLISYNNFSEIFDSPFSAIDSQSDSAVDVNPSDGQEITAVIPFFGDSTFGAAMKDSVLLVFKTNSIYLVNLAAKAAGQNPIQRLESMGMGCTFPNSVAPTRNGIMFANQSGVYRIDQSMQVYYLGRRLQRAWRQQTNLLQADLAFGHNHAAQNRYMLSIPTLSNAGAPDQAFVYNNTREYSMQGITNTIQLYSTREGSWTQYVPPPKLGSLGFANLEADSYYAAPVGRVFIRRNTGLPQDYRDDDQAIAMDLWMRGMDYGDSGTRKSVPWALVTYRNPAGSPTRNGTQVYSAVDFTSTWTPADLTTLPANPGAVDDLDDGSTYRVVTYRYSFAQKRGIRFHMRLTNSTKDEPVEITQVRYIAAGLIAPLGTREAASGPAPSSLPSTGRG